MPIYEFRCKQCGTRFEKLCSMGENGENIKCPECGAENPGRVMSSFRAKGSDKNTEGAPEPSGCATCSSSSCSSCGI